MKSSALWLGRGWKLHAYKHACMHACMHARMHVCMYTWVCIEAYVDTDSWIGRKIDRWGSDLWAGVISLTLALSFSPLPTQTDFREDPRKVEPLLWIIHSVGGLGCHGLVSYALTLSRMSMRKLHCAQQ